MASETRRDIFRQNLQRLMEAKGYSPRQLATECDLPLKWVKRACEQGLDRLYARNQSQLSKIAATLGVKSANSFWRDDCDSDTHPLVIQLQELLQANAGGPFEEALERTVCKQLSWLSSSVEQAQRQAGLIFHELESQFPIEWEKMIHEYQQEKSPHTNFVRQLAIWIIDEGEAEVRQCVLGQLQYIASELGIKSSRHRVTESIGDGVRGQTFFAIPDTDDDEEDDTDDNDANDSRLTDE